MLLRKALIYSLKRLGHLGSWYAMDLVRWTGKGPERIHPKHLVPSDHHFWYLHYIDSGDKVFDVGCGSGIHTMACATHCVEAVGFDHDAQEIGVACRLVAQNGLENVCFFLGDAEVSWPIHDDAFDVVLLLDLIEHINDRDHLLGEVRRVLKPDGKMLLAAPNRDTSWKRWQKSVGLFYYADPDHKIEYTADEIQTELSKHGFETVGELHPVVYDTPLAGLIDLAGGISLRLYSRLARWKREQALRHPEESTGWRIVAQPMDYLP